MFDLTVQPGTVAAVATAIDAALGTDPSLLADEVLAQEVAGLIRQQHRLDAAIAERVSQLRVRDLSHDDGAPTARSWLRARLHLSDREAGRWTTLAQVVDRLPHLAAGLRTGEVPAESALLIRRGLRGIREADIAEQAEKDLARAATAFAPEQLRALIERIRDAVIPDQADLDSETLAERRSFHASPTLDGMVVVNGSLSPELGSLLLGQLAAHGAPLPDDERSPAQRRHDVLHELLLKAAADDHTQHGGQRPHVTMVVHLDQLLRHTDPARGDTTAQFLRHLDDEEGFDPNLLFDDQALPKPTRYDTGTRADWVSALAVLCDAEITRVVLTGDDTPINLGRATRQWSPEQRREISRRDHTCRWQGCHRPANWCEIDHIVPWWDGGTTDITNGRLLCLYHHRLRHQGWTLTPTEEGHYHPEPPPDWHHRTTRRKRHRPPRYAA